MPPLLLFLHIAATHALTPPRALTSSAQGQARAPGALPLAALSVQAAAAFAAGLRLLLQAAAGGLSAPAAI